MIISHLVAVSNNLVIGVKNDLPWKLKRDLQHFSAYTQNKAIIMGRKTFESIGRPLPNRKNIVISKTMRPENGIEVTSNLEQAIQLAEKWNIDQKNKNEVVLIGGGYVFEESKDLVNKLVLTQVDCDINGDVFYPKLDFSTWKKESEESYKKDSENDYDFKIETYSKF
jgi:dihydrofolate reductase|tara:strand:+ start:96 stop:599 length:504 start_codon:yes stop_codon:yes gene_type:complete